jgi:hypothetical protein
MTHWTATSIFEAYFRPLYPPDLRDDPRAIEAARSIDANPGGNPRFLRELDHVAAVFAGLAPEALGKSDLVLDVSDASVHRLGAAIDRPTRDALFGKSTPGDPQAPIVNVVVHGAIYVGRCIVERHGGVWGVRRPLWESVVRLRSRAGEGDLTPFHWWLKSLADDEIDKATLVARYRQHVERATARPESLPKIVTTHVDRKLPTLKIVRYDTLHKHLRAHLPELKDLGANFPSPEQFADLGLLELEMTLLGEGRMLLMHGRGKRGLHLFWLDFEGFSHAMLLPADPGAAHSVALSGETLVVRFTKDGRELAHETLWWG